MGRNARSTATLDHAVAGLLLRIAPPMVFASAEEVMHLQTARPAQRGGMAMRVNVLVIAVAVGIVASMARAPVMQTPLRVGGVAHIASIVAIFRSLWPRTARSVLLIELPILPPLLL